VADALTWNSQTSFVAQTRNHRVNVDPLAGRAVRTMRFP
jgi:hypothetical protein